MMANDQTVAGSSNPTGSSLHANKGKKKRKYEVADRNRPRLAPHLNKETYDNDLTSKRCKIKRERFDSEEHTLALKVAKELQANLSSEHPSFVKQLQKSHVKTKFVLGIPKDFCRLHLPAHNHDVILEDESGESYTMKFHPGIECLFIGGWRRFPLGHNLLEGDVLVFHLLKPCYFKVYIVRANNPKVVQSANLKSCNVRTNEGKKKRRREVAERKEEPPPLEVVQETSGKSPLLSRSDHHSSDMEVSTLSGQVADFEKFKIIVNNEVIDPELSRSIRFKYYNLCCCQKSYLHNQLLKNVDRTMAAGVIAGTVKVAETIRDCKLYTSDDDFSTWDNTLEGLKRFGMDVGFLCDRLKQLLSLASEFRATEEVKKYIEARKKLDCAEEKMMSTEMEFLGWKRSRNKLEDEMKTMKVNIDKCRDTFLEEAIAPW